MPAKPQDKKVRVRTKRLPDGTVLLIRTYRSKDKRKTKAKGKGNG